MVSERALQFAATSYECEVAASEEHTLVRRFFDYQAVPELKIRRLVLGSPASANEMMLMGEMAANRGSGMPRKRKEIDMEETREHVRRVQNRLDGERVATCGATFGCTLGNIVGYLSGRQIPSEKAAILKSVRCFLIPAADAVRLMHGTDRQCLARGLASCRVTRTQRPFLRELVGRGRMRIDSKYGNTGAAIGCTASLLACFSVMAERPLDNQHFVTDGSLALVLEAAASLLETWKMNAPFVDNEYWFALGVEHRCAQRAMLGARRAQHEQRKRLPASARTVEQAVAAVREQLEWARAGAFPSNVCVCENNQAAICEQITNGSFCATQCASAWREACEAPPTHGLHMQEGVQVIPLAELGLDAIRLVRGRRADDGESSSVVTTTESRSSQASSGTASSQQSAGWTPAGVDLGVLSMASVSFGTV
tara:strand:+ start:696 stop:1970 length:1275 start_codon:yes stop_codon:yes gene_type:complete